MSSLKRGNAESLMAISCPAKCSYFLTSSRCELVLSTGHQGKIRIQRDHHFATLWSVALPAVSLFVRNADVCRPNGPNQLGLRPCALYTLQVHVLTVCYQSPNFTRSLDVNQRWPKNPLDSRLSISSKFASWSMDLKLGVLKCLIARTGRKIAGGWDNSLQVPTCDWPFGSSLRKSEVTHALGNLLNPKAQGTPITLLWWPRVCLWEAHKHLVSYRTSHTVEFEAPPVQPASSPMQKLSTSHSTKHLPTQRVWATSWKLRSIMNIHQRYVSIGYLYIYKHL